MTMYLLSVHNDPAEDLDSIPEEELEQIYDDVEAFNDSVKQAGRWVFAGGRKAHRVQHDHRRPGRVPHDHRRAVLGVTRSTSADSGSSPPRTSTTHWTGPPTRPRSAAAGSRCAPSTTTPDKSAIDRRRGDVPPPCLSQSWPAGTCRGHGRPLHNEPRQSDPALRRVAGSRYRQQGRRLPITSTMVSSTGSPIELTCRPPSDQILGRLEAGPAPLPVPVSRFGPGGFLRRVRIDYVSSGRHHDEQDRRLVPRSRLTWLSYVRPARALQPGAPVADETSD